MRVVVLVPWRGGEAVRELNWAITRPHLEALGYPVICGDREGPWSRAAACNDAARRAGYWDVAVIADADTLCQPGPVHEAVRIASDTGVAVRPHDHLWRLRRSMTGYVARRGIGGLRPQHATGVYPGGGLLVLTREALRRAGSYDERFVGWGHEDSALNHRLLAEGGWCRIEGNAWHLYHPHTRPSTPEYQQNRKLLRGVERANAGVVGRASAEAGYDVGAVL